ncbi:Nucleotidyltransferase/DNA polymerase involved in DNA repair-like protein [Chthoniobacter flavus Ellin428]|uniref:Nucleotidyltransferase/DNA polymerase involved in DNA repair-like protein n=1 Tax=Chthoniobacter flavus Ellin428 TaxID=497964 RepID=B4DB63_9BACT|nr:DNA polymerase Y family protein [Chthoniobacter flavus]EDY16341.1 Nucleotidyltransferase/DNA polymerase involved in DNA repair-like protein [Chthoniobacter flavus Ellin428]TCO90244.1 protein ImuB [Chthoniobacter flavus]
MSWFTAILLPQFSLQAALRFHEEAWRQPVAITDGDTEKGRVLETTIPAAHSGVWPGMVVTQALARCPSLRLLQRSRTQEEVVSALLLETTGTLSPLIEATAEGLCVADLRQMKACDWEPWARGVVERFATRQLRVQVGLAANPDLAILAARHAEPALVVQHAGAFLAGVAVTAVDAAPGLLEILRDWGIGSLGELARLPRSELIERLGPEAGALWEQAAGRAHRELRLVRPPEVFWEAFEFEHPIETTEPLLFILRRQLEQLMLRLEEAYRVAAQMTLTIPLEPGPSNVTAGTDRYERTFTIPSPTTDTEVLFRILHTHLENLRLEQQPIGVRLRVEPVVANRSQFQLFESPLRDPNRFGETLGRIAALVGAENVGVVQLEDTHQPDRFQLVAPDFQTLSEREKAGPTASHTLGLPLRRFRPPLPAQVRFERHVPKWLSSPIAQGEVIDMAGPYRVSGQWWDSHEWSAEEWDIELSDGALYRISKSQGTCFLEGCYEASVR